MIENLNNTVNISAKLGNRSTLHYALHKHKSAK